MLETGSVKCPTPHVSEPLPLGKVEVRKRADVRGVNHERQIYGALTGWQLPIGWQDPHCSEGPAFCPWYRKQILRACGAQKEEEETRDTGDSLSGASAN